MIFLCSDSRSNFEKRSLQFTFFLGNNSGKFLCTGFLQFREPNFANPRMNEAARAGRELSLKMRAERKRKEKREEKGDKRQKAGGPGEVKRDEKRDAGKDDASAHATENSSDSDTHTSQAAMMMEFAKKIQQSRVGFEKKPWLNEKNRAWFERVTNLMERKGGRRGGRKEGGKEVRKEGGKGDTEGKKEESKVTHSESTQFLQTGSDLERNHRDTRQENDHKKGENIESGNRNSDHKKAKHHSRNLSHLRLKPDEGTPAGDHSASREQVNEEV
jgi:hypothetical protein